MPNVIADRNRVLLTVNAPSESIHLDPKNKPWVKATAQPCISMNYNEFFVELIIEINHKVGISSHMSLVSN